MKKIGWSLLALTILIFSACATEEDPCTTENTGYIVVANSLQGIDAEAMEIRIDGQYIQDVPPGGESVSISKKAGLEYEVKGTTGSGKIYLKDITVDKCVEDVVLLGN